MIIRLIARAGRRAAPASIGGVEAAPGGRRRSSGLLAVATLLLATACGGASAGSSGAGGAAQAAASAVSSADAGSGASGGATSSGSALLAFRGTTVDGKPFDGASLTGKPVVLWFWAPWCPTCLSQAPGVRAAVERSGASVNLVGVAGLDTAKAMPEFVRLAKVGSMTHIADEAGVLWKQFGITEQSFFVFLDANGKETFRGKLRPDDIAGRVAGLAT